MSSSYPHKVSRALLNAACETPPAVRHVNQILFLKWSRPGVCCRIREVLENVCQDERVRVSLSAPPYTLDSRGANAGSLHCLNLAVMQALSFDAIPFEGKDGSGQDVTQPLDDNKDCNHDGSEGAQLLSIFGGTHEVFGERAFGPAGSDTRAMVEHLVIKTHDLWHLTLNLLQDAAGEAAVAAYRIVLFAPGTSAAGSVPRFCWRVFFLVAKRRLAGCASGQASEAPIHDHEVTYLIEAMTRGVIFGYRQSLLAIHWADAVHRPLSSVRESLGLHLDLGVWGLDLCEEFGVPANMLCPPARIPSINNLTAFRDYLQQYAGPYHDYRDGIFSTYICGWVTSLVAALGEGSGKGEGADDMSVVVPRDTVMSWQLQPLFTSVIRPLLAEGHLIISPTAVCSVASRLGLLLPPAPATDNSANTLIDLIGQYCLPQWIVVLRLQHLQAAMAATAADSAFLGIPTLGAFTDTCTLCGFCLAYLAELDVAILPHWSVLHTLAVVSPPLMDVATDALVYSCAGWLLGRRARALPGDGRPLSLCIPAGGVHAVVAAMKNGSALEG